MADSATDGPSNRARRQLNNRNNLADLKLRKALQQFDRERTFSIAHMDRDKLDTRDFLKTVKFCDSDYLPQSRTFLGSPSNRRRRSHTARTAPGRIGREDDEISSDARSDDDMFDVVERDSSVPVVRDSRLLASRKTTNPRILNDYQRAERFLRQLREQVAVEELHSHYTDSNYHDFVAAVVSKIQRPVTPTVGTPSLTFPNGPTQGPTPGQREAAKESPEAQKESVARFDLVYPIRLLGDFGAKYDVKAPSPSPSLGEGSPRIRATPLGLPGGGALGLGARRLVMTAPQTVKPRTALSLNSLPANPHLGLGVDSMRAMLKFQYRHKPLDERVKDFCTELDDIRMRRSQILPKTIDGPVDKNKAPKLPWSRD